MASEPLFRDRVRERDLDNFLVEEIHASSAFLGWLLEKLKGCIEVPKGLQLKIQKSPPRLQDNRQTDVRLGWFAGSELRACVLIESKVTADFQPGQAESYAAEKTAHCAMLGQSKVAALLIAPHSRLGLLDHKGAFDAALSIEEISEFLHSRREHEQLGVELSSRLEARIELLEALSGKRATGAWTPITIAAKRDFAEAYREVAAELVPRFPVRPSTDGPKAITRIFELTGFAPDLPRTTLRHEFGDGHAWKYANIQFPGLAHRVEAVRQSGQFEGTGFEVTDAGKSLAIRVPTPPIDPTQPFESQEERVRAGLTSIAKLLEFVEQRAARIAVLFRD